MWDKRTGYHVAISVIVASIFFLIGRIIFFCQIKNLQKSPITDNDLINISWEDKNIDIQSFQNTIVKSIESNKENVVAIAAETEISLITENQVPNKETITKKIVNKWNGIIVSKDGYIITNKHVVQETWSNYLVKKGQATYKVDKIRFDPYIDIAVIKVKSDKEFTPAVVNTIEDIIPQWSIVFAMKAWEKNAENIVSMWIISAKNQEFTITNNKTIYVGLYQTDANITAGYSWWPLINILWKVIGINTAITTNEKGIAYSIPLNQEFINETLESIKKEGKIIRPNIWIKTSNSMKESNWIIGTEVTEIEEESIAQKAWVEQGDIIIGINGKKFSSETSFIYELFSYKLGKTITLNVMRGNKKMDFEVLLWKKQ